MPSIDLDLDLLIEIKTKISELIKKRRMMIKIKT
jgi:hypothetical protein